MGLSVVLNVVVGWDGKLTIRINFVDIICYVKNCFGRMVGKIFKRNVFRNDVKVSNDKESLRNGFRLKVIKEIW